ncbi:MAG TPA: deoxyhypusine synthase family protein [Patescibacteria group bacterium]|nr:deoxyhypusine synthase family protein [Patescibacteria group bacterium]
MTDRKRPDLKPLEMLDLGRARTLGGILDGMSRCSFGARMLGEAAATLASWCRELRKPVIVYDGDLGSPLGGLLRSMVAEGLCYRIMRPATYAKRPAWRASNALVVGDVADRHAASFAARAPRTTLFVNDTDLANPGQVKDGYFPDAVFTDPRFAMPVLAAAVRERLGGPALTAGGFVGHLRAARYGGIADQTVTGADTLIASMEDPACRRFLTLSGAMTVAQMSLVICEMIDRGMVHSVTSTGALMAHGLVPGLGLRHYKYDPGDDDRTLAALSLNRVTDTLEPETNFDHIDDIMQEVLGTFSGDEPISPRILHAAIGKYLVERHPDQRAILASAFRMGVPVFVPAFVDSELGNDVFVTNRQRELEGKRRVTMDLELDSAELIRLMTGAEHAAIWTFGGGVPRNWTQNVSPLLEIHNARLAELGLELPVRKFRYGCKVCPDRPHFGHLSGCTYEEGKSWRKFDLDGMFAEIHGDATQVWPILVKHVMDWQDGRH